MPPTSPLHLDARAIDERLAALPAPPRDEAVVELVVVRPESDRRITPDRARLTPEGGVEGDRWALAERRVLGAQVTLMRADVARVFANGQPISLPGDNLLVTIDLSPENLPTGTLVRVGSAVCTVTDKPHTGCAKFEARFGRAAREATLSPAYASTRLRGLHLRVLEAGDVGPGDRLVVLTRGG